MKRWMVGVLMTAMVVAGTALASTEHPAGARLGGVYAIERASAGAALVCGIDEAQPDDEGMIRTRLVRIAMPAAMLSRENVSTQPARW